MNAVGKQHCLIRGDVNTEFSFKIPSFLGLLPLSSLLRDFVLQYFELLYDSAFSPRHLISSRALRTANY